MRIARWALRLALVAVVSVSMPFNTPGIQAWGMGSDHHQMDTESDDEQNELIVVATHVDEGASSTTSAVESISSSVSLQPSFIPVCEREGALGLDSAFGCSGKQLECEGGLVFDVITFAPDGTSTTSPDQCIKNSDIPTDSVIDIPGEVLRQFKKVGLPASSLSVQPPGGKTLVNLATVFSTNAQPFTTGVDLEKVNVTVTLEIWPSEFRWHFGDDSDALVTTSPGEPWSEGADMSKLITHTYSKVDEKIPVSVDTTWAARWKVKGTDNPWQDVAGTVTIEGTPQELDVLEAKPLLVKH